MIFLSNFFFGDSFQICDGRDFTKNIYEEYRTFSDHKTFYRALPLLQMCCYSLVFIGCLIIIAYRLTSRNKS
jgi:hypothetical protein